MEYNGTTLQHSLDWYRSRLGFFSASRIADLLGTPRTKGQEWTGTALTYIYQVAAERMLNESVVENDGMFEYYLDTVNATTRAMQYGTEHEADARLLYATIRGVEVEETGSVQHPTIPWLSASPDGIVKGQRIGIEIKCPTMAVYMRYLWEVRDGDTLKAVNRKYYDQCQCQMMCCDLDAVDFVIYCEFLSDPIHIIRIPPDEAEISLIQARVEAANLLAVQITAKQKKDA